MRFGIQKKLLLLIALLSLALISASVLVSSQLYARSLDDSIKKLCAETAATFADEITDKRLDVLNEFKDKIAAVYAENRVELEEAATREFESFDKREEFYSRFTEGIFPPKQGLGLSYQMLLFKTEYEAMLNSMDMLSYAGGLDTASVFYYDAEHGNAVYLVDRMPEGSTLYNFPASVKKLGDGFLKSTFDAGAPAVSTEGGECRAVAPVKGTGGRVFVLFAKQNTETRHSVRLFMLYTLSMLLGATLVIGLVMLMFADRLIVRNVKKLSAAAEKFTSQVGGGSPERVYDGVSSNDEIGDLSERFGRMQDSILGYIDRIEENSAREHMMQAELALAARIQADSLPAGGLEEGCAVINSFLKPAREVGGDLYDYFPLDGGRVFFCLADVSGKGVPASLFMMRAKELIRAHAAADATLGELAFKLNNELCAGNEESIFITAFFGLLDTVSCRLEYLRAGHEQPMLRRGGSVTRIGEESNLPLGIFGDSEFVSDSITLLPGDALLMFTDGLNEGINGSKEEFGYGRIADAFLQADGDIAGVLYAKLAAFCEGAEQFDDVTMLTLCIKNSLRIETERPCWDDIPKVTQKAAGLLYGFDRDRVSEVGIIIDEVMNNQISYAFGGADAPEASLELRLDGGVLTLAFEDNGTPFDPLTDVTQEDIDSSEGGFGLALVRAMTDSQSYERRGGLNVLTLVKDMTRAPAEQ